MCCVHSHAKWYACLDIGNRVDRNHLTAPIQLIISRADLFPKSVHVWVGWCLRRDAVSMSSAIKTSNATRKTNARFSDFDFFLSLVFCLSNRPNTCYSSPIHVYGICNGCLSEVASIEIACDVRTNHSGWMVYACNDDDERRLAKLTTLSSHSVATTPQQIISNHRAKWVRTIIAATHNHHFHLFNRKCHNV